MNWSSLYRYYAGVEDLIEAVSMRGLDEWIAKTRDEVIAAKDDGPRAAIRVFVESNLRRAPEGDLRWRHQLLRVHLDEAAHRRMEEEHTKATEILAECVAELPDLADDARADLLESLRSLINGGVMVVADHPGSADAHVRMYTAAADAMIDRAAEEPGNQLRAAVTGPPPPARSIPRCGARRRRPGRPTMRARPRNHDRP